MTSEEGWGELCCVVPPLKYRKLEIGSIVLRPGEANIRATNKLTWSALLISRKH